MRFLLSITVYYNNAFIMPNEESNKSKNTGIEIMTSYIIRYSFFSLK